MDETRGMVMRYLLDTNACIAFMRGNTAIKQHFWQQKDGNSICLCAVVQAELWHGVYAAAQSTERRGAQVQNFFKIFEVLPFDEQAAHEYGKIKTFVEPLEKEWQREGRKFKSIGDNDLLIAAIARSRDLVLVSRDSDFDRIPNLRRENWEED
ncbi:MAG: type II toxin-antitoxin system VapC family toxin [Candidatus Kapaibacteriota bacterium]